MRVSISSYPKIGIALGSGGAKGLAHIGVLKALEAHNIPISYVAGSSIGALIGAYYAAYPSSEKLEQLALSFNRRRGFSLFDPTLRGGLIKGNKMETLISELLEEASFQTLKIPFAAVATDFNSGREVIITDGDLQKAIRASISVPAFFQPLWYGKKLLADGGLSDPVPTEVVKYMGSDIVVAVTLDSVSIEPDFEKTPPLSGIPVRSINILRHNLAIQATKTADIIISPSVYQVGLIGWSHFFDTKKAQTIIKAGEDAANDVIPKLKDLIDEKRKQNTGIRKYFSFFRRFSA